MWYYMRNNQRLGPVSGEELRTLIANGTVVGQTLVWNEEMQEWAQAGTTKLAVHFSSAPPSPPSHTSLTTYSMNPTVYEPQSFRKLWLWFAWLVGAGLPLCFIFIGIAPLIAGGVIGYILLYRFWDIIQDGNARTSPSKAVGFCFIPFFNFYWLFIANVGLAKDMNTYCNERDIAGPRISEGLALTYCILSFCGMIPYVGIVTGIACIVIWIVLYKQFGDTASRIAKTKLR